MDAVRTRRFREVRGLRSRPATRRDAAGTSSIIAPGPVFSSVSLCLCVSVAVFSQRPREISVSNSLTNAL
jgi:hypothetical protein